ncbi:MAG: WD40 repeat domain-containing protein [Anaerolineae bacterium]|nr:WD40 repeat domain-containing protein [Anaerolineae bacterium]
MKNMVCNLQKITICLFVILFSSAQAQTDPIASNEIREIAWSPFDSLDQTIHFETQTESRISNFAWSPNGQQLAASTLSPENALKIWDITTGELTFEYRDVGEDVIGVGWSPDNQQILASAAESLNGYNGILVNPTTLETTRLKLPLAVDITWSMNGKQIAFVGITWLLVLQRDDFSPIFTTQVETRNNINLQSQLVKVAWHPLQPEITAATGDGRAFVWQLGDPQPRLSLTTHDYTGQEFLLGWVYQLRYSATGETLTSIAGDGTIRTWNTTDGALLSEQRVSPNFGADFSPTGARGSASRGGVSP